MCLAVMKRSGWESFGQLMGVLLVFVFVLAITYVCTRWFARYQKGITADKNIQVIETLRVTNNKYIQIVEVGKSCFVIAVCKDTVTLLGEVNKEDLTWKPKEDLRMPGMGENFQEILQKWKDKLPRK